MTVDSLPERQARTRTPTTTRRPGRDDRLNAADADHHQEVRP